MITFITLTISNVLLTYLKSIISLKWTFYLSGDKLASVEDAPVVSLSDESSVWHQSADNKRQSDPANKMLLIT